MPQYSDNNPALLKNKGRFFVWDESAAVKGFTELTLVDNVKVMSPTNPIEIKSTSGITVYKSIDPDFQLSFDWYHPGDLKKIELLTRGVFGVTSYTGSSTQTETVAIRFRKAGEAAILPGFNGAKTAVTVTTVKSLDLATTYTVSTDYTVTAESTLGMTMITQVSMGAIPLNTDVLVNYTYTPLKSNIVRPNYDATLVERYVRVDSYTDITDLTKYRSYFLPRATITSELAHDLLDLGKDNTKPNIMSVTLSCAKPDIYTQDPLPYWIDTSNV